MASSSCAVCCSPYTASLRKRVTCPYCTYDACVVCVRKYMLSSTQEASCMQCHATWSMDFLDTWMTPAFRQGEFARHRQDVLLERERAKLPATMAAVEREKQKRALLQQADETRKDIKRLRTELHAATELYQDLQLTARDLTAPGPDAPDAGAAAGGGVRACPQADCRGFLSPDTWTCGVCDACVCQRCHVRKTSAGLLHVCRLEDVQTVEQVEKDSKPCPGCGTRISKVDGCDQMWCPCCKSAFSWRTGALDRGYIHNPEYFRWMREHSQAIPAWPQVPEVLDRCGLPPSMTALRAALPEPLWDERFDSVRVCVEQARYFHMYPARHVLERRGPHTTAQDPHQDLRVRYLFNELTEDAWKHELGRREQRRHAMQAKFDLFQMFVLAGTDLLHRAMACQSLAQTAAVLEELEALRRYFNAACVRVQQRFHATLIKPVLEDWKLGA